jgi:hypothetical protein
MKRKVVTLWPFWMLTMVCGLILGIHAWRLLPLLDAKTRADVRAAVEFVAEERGWLISDISIISLANESIKLLHTPHVRKNFFKDCVVVTMSSHSISTCDFAHP